MSEHNPLGREYNAAELNAAMRCGITTTQTIWNGTELETVPGGPLIYATGNHWPEHARAMASAWSIVADAMEREWSQDDV